ncbi:MAG: SWIM zinc finger family protein [Polyangiaceae bacterium]
MRVDLRYFGSSGVRSVAGGEALAFSPNLAREEVFFDAELAHPLRYREAMSALHAVVVGDARYKKRDKSAYEAWKREKAREDADLRKAIYDRTREERSGLGEVPRDLELQFRTKHALYWRERRRWASELLSSDPALFRALVPCDPVVTVAPDVVFFECFAKDESAYGCLTVDRDAFRGADRARLGTTNVDYSLALFDHFQSLRSYRSTRLQVDPAGFTVKTEGNPDVREEKIDLPPSWLRGFGQIQAAMAIPARRVSLSTDVVYNIVAFLKRHRERTGPRSLRFELVPGERPRVILEPWETVLVSHGARYEGPTRESIRVWGRRRLAAFARTLPLAHGYEVRLLGTGLPSIWVADLGEMKMVLALSGWTANDWTSGTSLEHHFGDVQVDAGLVESVARLFIDRRAATHAELLSVARGSARVMEACLVALAKRGQLLYDFAHRVHRYRPILPVALSEKLLGPEPEEIVEGRRLLRAGAVRVATRERLPTGWLVRASVGGQPCEAIIDADGALKRAECSCSHFFKSGLRRGPCRHLFAVRGAVERDIALPSTGEVVLQ